MSASPERDVLYPPLQAALGRGDVEAVWRDCDQHTRGLWCRLAHLDNEVTHPYGFQVCTWTGLPQHARIKLSASLGVIRSFLRGFKATFEEIER